MSNQPDRNPALHKLLREWELKETLPPRLSERVWHRLARGQSQAASVWVQLVQRLTGALARPSMAVTYMTLLLLGGVKAGYLEARQQNAEASASLRARYVQMIDPYQMPR